uniref:Uncharacterized protein n=1 Tax=Rhizophora mucronata TaxID=61149 RepID=A0A2P2LKU9_RHIMU
MASRMVVPSGNAMELNFVASHRKHTRLNW